ncbi:hypothetical protein K4L44_16435 [Halosquirtibacter laminarini]|uniref:Uncharacterized protein n=1 Tax=Halosquirtibacter laminarini TaxID=3374600 RepID=A0AC61NES9_9BACT|nr:hypothetical protein K4L44_16435 [Prolixibacteraceae bacterium]
MLHKEDSHGRSIIDMLWNTNSTEISEITTVNKKIELYGFVNVSLRHNMNLSCGVRTLVNFEENYVAYQTALNFDFSSKSSLIMSAGQYFNTLPSNFYHHDFTLQQSQQFAVDYNYTSYKTSLGIAFFMKQEKGGNYVHYNKEIDSQKVKGVELMYRQAIGDQWMFEIANTWIDSKMSIDQHSYVGDRDMDYFIKSSLQYKNSNGLSATLSFQSRQGALYTPIVSTRTFNQYKIPVYDNQYNNNRYNHYNRLDVMISKYIAYKNHSLVAFASVNNLLNNHNISSFYYDQDFDSKYNNYYTLRTFYLGFVWRWDYQK